MDLWVRSQDRKNLVKVNAIFIDDTDMVDKGFVTIYSQNCEFELGTYNSKERALEVLDEIQSLIKPKAIIQNINNEPTISDFLYRPNEQYTITPLSNVIVYEMPEE